MLREAKRTSRFALRSLGQDIFCGSLAARRPIFWKPFFKFFQKKKITFAYPLRA